MVRRKCASLVGAYVTWLECAYWGMGGGSLLTWMMRDAFRALLEPQPTPCSGRGDGLGMKLSLLEADEHLALIENLKPNVGAFM